MRSNRRSRKSQMSDANDTFAFYLESLAYEEKAEFFFGLRQAIKCNKHSYIMAYFFFFLLKKYIFIIIIFNRIIYIYFLCYSKHFIHKESCCSQSEQYVETFFFFFSGCMHLDLLHLLFECNIQCTFFLFSFFSAVNRFLNVSFLSKVIIVVAVVQ